MADQYYLISEAEVLDLIDAVRKATREGNNITIQNFTNPILGKNIATQIGTMASTGGGGGGTVTYNFYNTVNLSISPDTLAPADGSQINVAIMTTAQWKNRTTTTPNTIYFIYDEAT